MGSRGIPASRQTAERIEDLLAGGGDHDARSDLIRRGVRKLVEEVLEAEVEDRLGRAYYGRGDGERPGYRNGYRRGRLKSAEGAIEYVRGPDPGDGAVARNHGDGARAEAGRGDPPGDRCRAWPAPREPRHSPARPSRPGWRGRAMRRRPRSAMLARR